MIARFYILAYVMMMLSAVEGRAAQGEPLDILVHLEGHGDRSGHDGGWVGTRGQGRRLEGFAVNQAYPAHGLAIRYMCHLQGSGDTNWKREGEFCGTRGQARRLEGFAIRLDGQAARNYVIYYRCHLQDSGDSEWKREGEFCGTRGQARRVEAIDIHLERY